MHNFCPVSEFDILKIYVLEIVEIYVAKICIARICAVKICAVSIDVVRMRPLKLVLLNSILSAGNLVELETPIAATLGANCGYDRKSNEPPVHPILKASRAIAINLMSR
jgi:hypothetical protein